MEERIEGLGGIELNGKEYQLSGMVFVHGHKRTLFLLSDYLLCCQKIRVIYFFFLQNCDLILNLDFLIFPWSRTESYC